MARGDHLFGRGHFRGFLGAVLGEPPPRAERGEIRYLVLDAIKERPRHGYEVIQHIEERGRNRRYFERFAPLSARYQQSEATLVSEHPSPKALSPRPSTPARSSTDPSD